MAFTFTPQNFVDQVGPVAAAAWLNGVDLTVNNALQGLTTTAEIAALLGVTSISLPLAINQGGTGATTAAGALTALGFNQGLVGTTLWPQTAQEVIASVVPANYAYPPGDIRRYGAIGDGATDNAGFLTTANSVGIPLVIPLGTYNLNSGVTLTAQLNFIGGIFKPVSSTLTLNCSINAAAVQIFDVSSSGVVAGKFQAACYPVEWWGAFGNGKRGNSGVLASSTAFTDANASFTAADVGKAIFIQQLPGTSNPTFIGTIAAYVSATAVTLNTAATWSGTGLSYYYGKDDTAAITAANNSVGQLTSYFGPATPYNLYNQINALAFTGSNIYLTTAANTIAGGSTAGGWMGVNGWPTIAFGVAGGTTDCLTMGAGANTNGAFIENLTLDGNYSGQELLRVAGYQSPRIKNLKLLNAKRNSLAFTPAAGSWVQQGDFQNVYILSSGLHNVYINPASTAYVNECDFINLNMQGCSALQNGGAAFYRDTGAGATDSWTIMNYKATAILEGSFVPSGSPFVFATSCFSEVGISFKNGYSEGGSSGSPIGATNAPFFVASTCAVKIKIEGYYSNYWGMLITHADHDAASSFTGIPHGNSQGLMTAPLNNGYAGDFFIFVTDGGGVNFDYARFSVIGSGLGTSGAVVTQIGTTVSSATPLSWTVTASNSSNHLIITFNNTGVSGNLNVSYSALGRDFGAIPAYNY